MLFNMFQSVLTFVTAPHKRLIPSCAYKVKKYCIIDNATA